MHADTTGSGRNAHRGFWDNLATGLKVVGSELRWIVLGRVRAFEIMQLRRRLEREYEALGRLAEPVLAGTRTDGEQSPGALTPETARDVDLCLKQIEFLREEIAQLESERQRSRRQFVARRAEGLGVTPPRDPGQEL